MIPLSTLSLVLLTSSLVLTVLVGGTIFLIRSRKSQSAPAPATTSAPAAEEPEKGVIGADVVSWEAELASKIDRLEEAFNLLCRKLEAAEQPEGERREITILSKREANREELLPHVAELRARGLHSSAIAKKLGLSDEQVALLLNSSGRSNVERVVGA